MQTLSGLDKGIHVVFAAKNEDGSPLAGEASSLSMKVRTRQAWCKCPGVLVGRAPPAEQWAVRGAAAPAALPPLLC